MEKNQNLKLRVLGEQEATDSKEIVKWAKQTLTYGKAFPKCFDKVNLLRFCVSKEIRDMWAALTEGVEGAPADDHPEDLDLDSKEEEDLAKKREWHFEWLDAAISYFFWKAYLSIRVPLTEIDPVIHRCRPALTSPFFLFTLPGGA